MNTTRRIWKINGGGFVKNLVIDRRHGRIVLVVRRDARASDRTCGLGLQTLKKTPHANHEGSFKKGGLCQIMNLRNKYILHLKQRMCKIKKAPSKQERGSFLKGYE